MFICFDISFNNFLYSWMSFSLSYWVKSLILIFVFPLRIAKENLGFTVAPQKNLKNSTINEKDKHLALITLVSLYQSSSYIFCISLVRLNFWQWFPPTICNYRSPHAIYHFQHAFHDCIMMYYLAYFGSSLFLQF